MRARKPALKPYDELIKLVKEASLMASTSSLLSWDQETMMPAKGVEHRSSQMAQLARLSHEMATLPRIGELLEQCEGDSGLMKDATSVAAVNAREIRHDYDRKTRLPAELVEEEARLSSTGLHVWRGARQESDFSKFRPCLESMVDLLRRKAKYYGYPKGGEPWDALAEDYEPGCTAKDVQAVFAPLRERLQKLLGELAAGRKKPSNAFNQLKLPVEQQQKFVRFVAEQIGFEFERGRLDVSTHPFCGGTHCNDVRITTRFKEDNVNDALGSVMHECGHGMYEQGLLTEHIGTPMGSAVSLGIHESQSRMWENQVGRSRQFWKWLHPKLADFFGSAAGSLTMEDVYGGANIVKADFIRVEADEATYNMHIMIRFEIERAMLAGDLNVKDIPGAWNKKYKEYLGLTVPDDRRGCLQDVHWSMGSMGYFPTYTLGNLYSAQIFEKAVSDIPDLLGQFEKGRFSALKKWLNTKVHAHGRRYPAADLCKKVTGKALSAEPLMRYLEGKLNPIYGV
ncbi:MAG: carboxypeptidase M32 [Phycisphaerales bacterium]|nr:carboxypeptidase M32 [Phycisphaerales bacterium]MCI0674922.1 carboxypeptidase M32 [Phycisphaerales bacterium]